MRSLLHWAELSGASVCDQSHTTTVRGLDNFDNLHIFFPLEKHQHWAEWQITSFLTNTNLRKEENREYCTFKNRETYIYIHVGLGMYAYICDGLTFILSCECDTYVYMDWIHQRDVLFSKTLNTSAIKWGNSSRKSLGPTFYCSSHEL